MVKLASHRNPGLVDTHEPGTSFSTCKTRNLIWKSMFLRGNLTGEKKENTAGIVEEGECRELDKTVNDNRF